MNDKIFDLIDKVKKKYGIVGSSQELNIAIKTALEVSRSEATVLIIGESGVGKEIIPKIIHDTSNRRLNNYFAINCGSIPEGTIDSELFGHVKGAFTGAQNDHEGYFGIANNGTLFLDEVGELPLSTQARLLRVLETGEYIRVGDNQVKKTNVRIIAATNVNMLEAVKNGKFRQDLYYRLNIIPINLPPLRERKEDILLLFNSFVEQFCSEYKREKPNLSNDGIFQLQNYDWPGNIRELRNLVHRLCLYNDAHTITAEILNRNGVIAGKSYLAKSTGIASAGNSNDNNVNMEGILKLFMMLKAEIEEMKKDIQNLKSANNRTILPISNIDDTNITSSPSNNVDVLRYSHPEGNNFTIISDDEYEVAHSPVEITEVSEQINGSENNDTVVPLEELEKREIVKALKLYKGNRRKAAAELHISERTLYRKIDSYNIDIE